MKNQKKPQKKPQLNQYWIFGSILIGFLLLNIFSGAEGQNSKQISLFEFEEYAKAGDIEMVKIVNKRNVNVYLTRDAKLKDVHRKYSKNSLFGAQPSYTFKTNDASELEKSIQEFNKNLANKIQNENEDGGIWGDILISMLPFILIIAIWIFIMRRMSTGGGGAGGQIFSIGKSKAKLFDANSQVKITFKDVAGLEGAKEEVQEIVDFLKNPKKIYSIRGQNPKRGPSCWRTWHWENTSCQSSCW